MKNQIKLLAGLSLLISLPIAHAQEAPTTPILGGVLQSDLDAAGHGVIGASNLYTRVETDALLEDKADGTGVYTRVEADALLEDKADGTGVYTRVETDALLGGKADGTNVVSASDGGTFHAPVFWEYDEFNDTASGFKRTGLRESVLFFNDATSLNESTGARIKATSGSGDEDTILLYAGAGHQFQGPMYTPDSIESDDYSKAAYFLFSSGDYLIGDGTNLFYVTSDGSTTNAITSN